MNEILQAPEFQRLYGLCLSSVHPSLLRKRERAVGNGANRGIHSHQTADLVNVLCEYRPEFEDDRIGLIIGALLHDSGYSPFTHRGDGLLRLITGKGHEENAMRILMSSNIRRAINALGHTVHDIYEIINGKSEVGKVINNGNKLDLDNINNVDYFNESYGKGKRRFNPNKLAQVFTLENGVLKLDRDYKEEIKLWQRCREWIYDGIIYSDSRTRSAAALDHALWYIYKEKEKDLVGDGFFQFVDLEALQYLKENSNEAKIQIERAEKGILPEPLIKITTDNPTPWTVGVCDDLGKSSVLGESIAEYLGLPERDLTIEAFNRKSFRNPLSDEPPRNKSDIWVLVNPANIKKINENVITGLKKYLLDKCIIES